MRTLIINGSPKGEKGNTHIFASRFVKGTKDSCDIKCIVREDVKALAESVADYDAVILMMPLYVHAMPGIVMKLFEQMQPLKGQHKSMGFVIQSGFMEPAQSRFAKRSLELICRRLNYKYIGTVIKGGSAGVYLMPENMNKKLFAALEELGGHYRQHGSFSESVINELEKEYVLSRRKAGFYQFLHKIGIGDMFWNSMLKKHNAHDMRRDKPFAPV